LILEAKAEKEKKYQIPKPVFKKKPRSVLQLPPIDKKKKISEPAKTP
jgi:hypothetical protein